MEPGSSSYNALMNRSGDQCVEMEHPHQYQPPFGNISHGNHQPDVLLNFRKRKTRNSTKQKRTVTRERDWEDKETSALLKLVNLPEFRPRRGTRSRKTDWELIVKAMQDELGADRAITTKRCKERMKTLTGDRYYKQASSNWDRVRKERDDLTEDDWRKTIEECGLTVEWYEAIKEYIQGPCKDRQGKCRMQLGRNVTTDCPSTLRIPMVDGPSEPIQTMGAEKTRKSKLNKQSFCFRQSCSGLLRQFWYRRHGWRTYGQFSQLRCLLLLYVDVQAQQFNSLNDSQRYTFLNLYSLARFDHNGIFFVCNPLSCLCRILSMFHNQKELSIYEDIIALKKLGLVTWEDNKKNGMGEGSGDNDELISELTYIDYGRLRVHKRFFEKVIDKNPVYDTSRIIMDKAMVTFDARYAPSGIRVLNLYECEELEVVDLSGFGELRVLSIEGCYELGEIIWCEGSNELRWLEIWGCDLYPPLQKFPYLQEFHCSPFSTDLFDEFSCGDGGGELDVSGCVRLRTLQIREDGALSCIRGLEGLHSLIKLDLNGCKALQKLPDIGHMKELEFLDVGGTAMEEIKGLDKLSSLQKLWCGGSKLKTLPDLSHLPHLQYVYVCGCPVTKDPSSPFFGKDEVEFNHEMIKHEDVSDVSDSEHVSNVRC